MAEPATITVFEILIPRTHGRTGVVFSSEELDDWVLETAQRFGGITTLGVGIFGVWYDTGRPVEDHSNWYKIGVKPADVAALRAHAQATATRFGQECIYFERCGEAEFVRP